MSRARAARAPKVTVSLRLACGQWPALARVGRLKERCWMPVEPECWQAAFGTQYALSDGERVSCSASKDGVSRRGGRLNVWKGGERQLCGRPWEASCSLHA